MLALVTGVLPLLTSCGLFDGGSTLDDAFEYLPASTSQLQFSDREAMAERLHVDDIDPRSVDDADLDDYTHALADKDSDPLATTELTSYVAVMRDGPFNDFDVQWQARATWGEDPDSPDGTAFVWKVGDDLDFAALTDDLVDAAYKEGGTDDQPIYSNETSAVDPDTGLIGGHFPLAMVNVMLDEDEHLVVGSLSADALAAISRVISDDADSLADDGSLDDLVDAADGDPETALVTAGGDDACVGPASSLPPDLVDSYTDLGRPEARALLVSGKNADKVVVALQYDDDDAAKADEDARKAFIEDGTDPLSQRPIKDLGDFEVDRDGDLLLIEGDWAGGPRQALQAETSGGGPGLCVPG